MLVSLSFWAGLASVISAAYYDYACTEKDMVISRVKPPNGAIVVSGRPGEGDYMTVQEGIDAALKTEHKRLFIRSGLYTGNVTISGDGIQIFGETTNICSYRDNVVRIRSEWHVVKGQFEDLVGTSTVIANGNGINLYNLIIENKGGQDSQAVALTSSGFNQGVYACQLIGEQDTFFGSKGSQFVVKSLIVGITDFIFGLSSNQVITHSDIVIPSSETRSYAHILAPGRRSADDPGFILINNCTVTLGPGFRKPGHADLGRAWGAFARAQYQLVRFTGDPEAWFPGGFKPMHTSDPESALAQTSFTWLEIEGGPDPSKFTQYAKEGNYIAPGDLLGADFPALYDFKFI
ncbi:pectin lyase fold/virulence factor [Protomyces lactucae-debilis]|uniref:pectinesterase n=1 Tax=Protomyces lactucae-debilis TaxID=2754530 RepID=A0A1Y2FS48_PROLT|nr:pectin lyase fold/virulence factor [Protomyces lactucae-debilis]ORY86124.1 pectin lyase fold/virulence factor [Protomyces lactucae-debilis]